MSERFKLRRDTDANWTANNPVLGEGEPGFAIDTGILKIGDGVTAWFELAGISGGGGGGSSYPLVDPGGTGDYLTIPDAFADGVYEMSLIAGMHQIAVPVEIDLTAIDRTKRMGFYGNHMNDTVVNAVDFAAISFLDVIMPVLTGTCTWPAGTGQITGTSTAFISECTVGDYIGKGDADVMGKIISIESNTAMTVEGLNPWGFTDTAFVLGYFPDFYVEDIRFTSDEANCSFFDFSEYMANCNIYIKNVINETKGMFYDNSGAINRLTRLYDLHETSWGPYTAYDTLALECEFHGNNLYIYDGFRAVNCHFMCADLNMYSDSQFVSCNFPRIDLTTVTEIEDWSDPFIYATGCMDINGLYNSPTEPSAELAHEIITPTAGPWVQPLALQSLFLVPVALNFNLNNAFLNSCRLVIVAKGVSIVTVNAFVDDGANAISGRTLTLTPGDGLIATVELQWDDSTTRWVLISSNSNTAGTGSVVLSA